MKCPLCLHDSLDCFIENYHHCKICDLIFLDQSKRLNKESEKKAYDFHKNSPNDPNYRKFLSKLTIPLLKVIDPTSFGLDFGSGPGPTISVMLEEEGHRVDNYDYYYANDKSVFLKTYDFITSSEVFEHLCNPYCELNKLLNSLKVGGILAIMTKIHTKQINFQSWYYRFDPTHICFYSMDTFRWISEEYGLELFFADGDVVIFKK